MIQDVYIACKYLFAWIYTLNSSTESFLDDPQEPILRMGALMVYQQNTWDLRFCWGVGCWHYIEEYHPIPNPLGVASAWVQIWADPFS